MTTTNVDSLQSWQYYPAPGTPERCHDLYRQFRALFVHGLPASVQSKLSFFFHDGDATRDDDGLFHRDDDGKWVVHVRPWTWAERQLPYLLFSRRDLIRRSFKKKGDFDKWFGAVMVWHHRVIELCDEVYQLVEDFATEVDQVSDYQLVHELRHPEARQKHLMRFVHYLPKKPGEVMASPHRDFSLITADCLTTAPGLCTTDEDHSLAGMELIPEKPGHIVLFPGRKMEKVTGGQIPGLCHGVVSTPPNGIDLNPEKELTRGAVIFFAHGSGPMGASCPS